MEAELREEDQTIQIDSNANKGKNGLEGSPISRNERI
jgi:hypothetical protein